MDQSRGVVNHWDRLSDHLSEDLAELVIYLRSTSSYRVIYVAQLPAARSGADPKTIKNNKRGFPYT